jgi:hypothetical protein
MYNMHHKRMNRRRTFLEISSTTTHQRHETLREITSQRNNSTTTPRPTYSRYSSSTPANHQHQLHTRLLPIIHAHLSSQLLHTIPPLRSAPSHRRVKTNMCFIILSKCLTCTRTLHLRYAPCSHAQQHDFDPVSCPNRMKRRRCSEGRVCGMCKRKGSLSSGPSGSICTSGGVVGGGKEERHKRKTLTRHLSP